MFQLAIIVHRIKHSRFDNHNIVRLIKLFGGSKYGNDS